MCGGGSSIPKGINKVKNKGIGIAVVSIALSYFSYVWSANQFDTSRPSRLSDLSGTLGNDSIDGSSITKQGNTFGGASQLLRNDPAGRLGINTATPQYGVDVSTDMIVRSSITVVGQAVFGGAVSKSTMSVTGLLTMGDGIDLFNVASPTATTPSVEGFMVYDSIDRKVCISTGIALSAWKCGGFDGGW